ncbi:MAG TPA: formimidoylglutamate deiminase [Ilumatobacteraceae bacterium]|nr:formimidoylglutamate deiminase [Ilumatobacteraceae bacterium]
MTTSYWCELAWLGGDTVAAGVTIDVDGDRITRVQPGVSEPPTTATRLAGLTLPGMANAHSHAFHRVLRGATQIGVGSFWTWREQMYEAAARLTPESYHRLARAVFAEMALAGITCVGEFHYLHHDVGGVPYDDPNAMGAALIGAAAAAGIRITLLDTCYLHGGIGVELDPVQRRFGDGDALAWATRASALESLSSATARIGAAIHSVRAVDPASAEVVGAWAADRDVPLHSHVSEQPAENEQCVAAYGITPVGLLDRHGLLGERFTAVHATHLTDADVDALGASRTTVCLCSTTERDLADGIGPARALRDAGSTLALGSDSHAVIDLFEEARAVEHHERLATLVRGNHDAPSLLRAATTNGHASLGWPDAGQLAVGALADLCTVRLDSVRLAGAHREHLLESVVFAATAADVDHVVVGGEVIVRNGTHVRIDVAAELAGAAEAV